MRCPIHVYGVFSFAGQILPLRRAYTFNTVVVAGSAVTKMKNLRPKLRQNNQ